MPPPAILHVAQPPEHGVARVAADLALDQARRGWRVAAAGPAGSDLRRWVEPGGVDYHVWEATRSPGPKTAGELRRLRGVVASVRPDLLHLHSSKAGLGRLLFRRRVPTVFQPHAWSFEAASGALEAAARGWERLAARWTDAIVCVSEDERRRGEQAGIRARWLVAPNGVDLDAFPAAVAGERELARRALGLGGGPVAVHVGRFCEQKGQDLLLAAWPAVRAQVPEAELVLVGDGPTKAQLADHLPAGARLEPETKDRVGRWLAAADVVVIPSRWEAGLPLIAMEAMARARSVVAADAAGMREGLGEGAGVVVPVGAPEPLAAAIAERLAQRERADDEGAQGLRRVQERHDVRRTVGTIAELYGELLSEPT